MTTRLALLPLTGAGDKYCKHCNRLGVGRCTAFGRHLGVAGVPMRIPECLSAERDAARMRKVEAAARALLEAVDAYYGTTDVRRIDKAIGAKNRAEAALRAALKETP